LGIHLITLRAHDVYAAEQRYSRQAAVNETHDEF
jgi:hypothetical protein